jgi:hypothetical protein
MISKTALLSGRFPGFAGLPFRQTQRVNEGEYGELVG